MKPQVLLSYALIHIATPRTVTNFEIAICLTCGENEKLSMSVKFATRVEGECCNHTNWQPFVLHEWITLFFTILWALYYHRLFEDGKMAMLTTYGETSNCCEISHLPVLKQTVEGQFSLDVLGKYFFTFGEIQQFSWSRPARIYGILIILLNSSESL